MTPSFIEQSNGFAPYFFRAQLYGLQWLEGGGRTIQSPGGGAGVFVAD